MSLILYGEFAGYHMVLEKAGDATDPHEHNFPHLAFIGGKGRLRFLTATKMNGDDPVEFNVDREVVISKGEPVLVPAKQLHMVVADEDDVPIWCLFLHRDNEGKPVSEPTGYMPAFQ